MATMHTVVMNDREYSFFQLLMERMSRDAVFSSDAEKIRKIFRRDIPVTEPPGKTVASVEREPVK